MNLDNYCGICKGVGGKRDLLLCCWKSICPEHQFSVCSMCKGIGLRLEFIVQNCQRCNEVLGDLNCFECNAVLCMQCSEQIHSQGKYKLHIREKVHLARERSCKKHLMPLDYFCNECKLNCKLCGCVHENMKINPVPKALANEVLDILDRVQKKVKGLRSAQAKYVIENDEYCDFIETLKKNVITEFSQIQKTLQIRKQEILTEIEKSSSIILESLRKKSEYLQESLEKFSLVSTLLTSTQHNSIDLYLLSKSSIFNLISQDFSLPVPPPHTLKFIFPSPESFLSSFYIESPEEKVLNFFPSEPDSNLQLKHRSSSMSLLPKKNLSKESKIVQYLPPRPSKSGRKSLPSSSSHNLKSKKNTLSQLVFTSILQSQNAVQISWSKLLPESKEDYRLECSLDGKSFNTVYTGELTTCIITELIRDKEYYFKVRTNNENQIGESDVKCVKTYPMQVIDGKRLENFAEICDGVICFRSCGVIYTKYPFNFGKHCWDVKVFSTLSTGFIKIGVCPPESNTIIGKSVIFGKNEVHIKVILDLDQGFLLFTYPNKTEDCLKITANAYFSVIQYKSNKPLDHTIRVAIDFNNCN